MAESQILNSNSYLQSSNYKLFLPFIGDDFIYAQNVTLPGFTLNPPQAYAGSGKFAYVGGDSLTIDPITVSFLCGEDFSLYKKLVKYITQRVHQNTGEIDPMGEFTCGIEITDNKGIPLIAFLYFGCKITNLSELPLLSDAPDAELIFTLTFNIDDWEMIDYFDEVTLEKIKKNVIKS